MAKRPVYWYEGMFIKPHHFQAGEQYHRERVRESEDWFHPHNWGLRSLSINEAAVADNRLELLHCQARFKDGTTISIPDEVTLAPIELHDAMSKGSRTPVSETTVYLAIPTISQGRANVQESPSLDGGRYYWTKAECPDENSGRDETTIEFRNVQARFLLSHRDMPITGYEVLPLAKIVRSADVNAPLKVDRTYVPPILGLDAWGPLRDQVKAIHHHIGAWITQESGLLKGRKVAFDSMVVGDPERILRLIALNTAFSTLQSVISTHGLPPIDIYRELCRVVGQLSIFGVDRRANDVDGYDHENIGPIYARVIARLYELIGGAPQVAFEKRYFQLEGRSFAVKLEKDWILETSKLYIGVETSELTDAECDEMMSPANTNWKLGSGEQVGEIFRSGAEGLKMKPVGRIPPALPSGVVYFEIERNPNYWKDVARTYSVGLRFNLERGKSQFLTNKVLALTVPKSQRTVDLQFAIFVVKQG